MIEVSAIVRVNAFAKQIQSLLYWKREYVSATGHKHNESQLTPREGSQRRRQQLVMLKRVVY